MGCVLCWVTGLLRAPQGCKAILQEYKCHNCEVIIKENATVDEFIDIIEGNRRYLPCLYCYNKIDCLCLEELAVFATRDHSIVISIHWVTHTAPPPIAPRRPGPRRSAPIARGRS